jgi:hypothetical protein
MVYNHLVTYGELLLEILMEVPREKYVSRDFWSKLGIAASRYEL